MGTEIEAKLKVESLADVEHRLLDCSAQLIARQCQSDTYYDDPLRALGSGDRCLRLRRQRTGDREDVVLTYKGPKQPDDFKKRQEIEVQVGDGLALDQILVELGYRKAIVVEKNRLLWRQGECLVALDEVIGLGTFVEIEGPDDSAIRQTQARLGLESLAHCSKSYASLLSKRRRQGRAQE